MTVELTDEQGMAVRRGESIRLFLDDVGPIAIVPLKNEEADNERELRRWKQMADSAMAKWGRENPYEP